MFQVFRPWPKIRLWSSYRSPYRMTAPIGGPDRCAREQTAWSTTDVREDALE
jgi:hypothetical protein